MAFKLFYSNAGLIKSDISPSDPQATEKIEKKIESKEPIVFKSGLQFKTPIIQQGAKSEKKFEEKPENFPSIAESKPNSINVNNNNNLDEKSNDSNKDSPQKVRQMIFPEEANVNSNNEIYVKTHKSENNNESNSAKNYTSNKNVNFNNNMGEESKTNAVLESVMERLKFLNAELGDSFKNLEK